MKMYAEPHGLNDYLDTHFTCDCGKDHYASLKTVSVRKDALLDLPKIAKEQGFSSLYLVSDAITYDIAGKRCMEILEELVVRGRELGQVVSDFTWYLRNLLLVKTSEQAQDIIDVSTEHFAVMQEECELVEAETLMRYIRVMSELSNQIRYATQKRVLIEIALIKLCRPSMETNYDSLLDRVRVLENKMEQGIPVQMVETTTNAPSKPVSQPAKEETVEALQKAVPEDLQEVAKNWDRICGLLSGTLKALVREATPSVGEGNSLLLVFDNEVHCGMFESEGHIEELKNAIERQIQKEIVVRGKFVDQRTVQQDAMLDLTKLTKMPIDFED